MKSSTNIIRNIAYYSFLCFSILIVISILSFNYFLGFIGLFFGICTMLCLILPEHYIYNKIKRFFIKNNITVRPYYNFDDYKDKYIEIAKKIIQLNDKRKYLEERIKISSNDIQKKYDEKLISKIDDIVSKLQIQKDKILEYLKNYTTKKDIYEAKKEYLNSLKFFNEYNDYGLNDDMDFNNVDNIFNDKDIESEIKVEEELCDSLRGIKR